MLASAGFTVCNGGFGGTMEAAARGAKEAGGKTIGITVDVFRREANPWIDEEIRKPTLQERLTSLVEKGDAYIVLKGGTGTLLELAYVWELINKRLIDEKPIVILGGFWNGVVEILRGEMLWEGLGDCTRFIYRTDTIDKCVRHLTKQLSS